jgi:hypothetical protein
MARISLILSIGALTIGVAACGGYDEKNAAYDGNNTVYDEQGNAAYDDTGNAAYDTSGNNAVYAPPPADGNASTDNMIGAPPPADPAVNNY